MDYKEITSKMGERSKWKNVRNEERKKTTEDSRTN